MTIRGVSSRLVPFRSLGLMAVALVMMGTALGAHAYGDKGVIRLQVGGGGGQFVYADTTTVYQRFYAGSKGSCQLDWDDDTSTSQPLAVLHAYIGDTLKDPPGFGATSIGVWDGPKGTPCSRVSTYVSESLTFALGAYTTETIGANAFDRLELDIEVKADAKIRLTMYVLDAVTRTYELRSGASIVAGEGLERGLDGAWPVSTSTARIFNCRARSDSGPDSGPNDNCRWIIEDLGQSFKIEPLVGEFSLEGGGDWGSLADQNYTLIHLTTVVEGFLDCDNPTPKIEIGDPANDAVCQVFSQPDPNGYCPSIHYVFRDLTGPTKGCEFIKGPDQQLAASMDITFPPEPRTDLYGLPPTFFEFPGASGYLTTDICNGELVTDGTTGLTSIKIDTLRKPNGDPVTIFNDAVPYPGNSMIDWACIQEHEVNYLGGSGEATEQMQVIQKLFFWGDPKGIRF